MGKHTLTLNCLFLPTRESQDLKNDYTCGASHVIVVNLEEDDHIDSIRHLIKKRLKPKFDVPSNELCLYLLKDDANPEEVSKIYDRMDNKQQENDSKKLKVKQMIPYKKACVYFGNKKTDQEDYIHFIASNGKLRCLDIEGLQGLQKLSVDDKIKKFAVNLELKQFSQDGTKWKKFYDFAGKKNFTWPPKMGIVERRLIFDYVVESEWEPNGEELAKNALKYHNLLESGNLDSQKGTHMLIVNGELKEYGSSKDEEVKVKKYPGCFYVPVSNTAKLRRFSAISDGSKDWLVHVRLRNPGLNRIVTIPRTTNDFRTVIDTGSHLTVFPYSVKSEVGLDCWNQWYTLINGEPYFSASRNLGIKLGDGNEENWTNEVVTSEICLRVRHANDNCGLIGYYILDHIPHYKPVGQPYIFLRDDINPDQPLRDII